MKDGVSGFGVGHKMKCRGITKCGENLFKSCRCKNQNKKNIETVKQQE